MSSKPKTCIEILFEFLEGTNAQGLQWIGEGEDEYRYLEYQLLTYQDHVFTHRVTHGHNTQITLLCHWGISLPSDPCAYKVVMKYLLERNHGLYSYFLVGDQCYLQAVHPQVDDCSNHIIDYFLHYETSLLNRITAYQSDLAEIRDLVQQNCGGGH